MAEFMNVEEDEEIQELDYARGKYQNPIDLMRNYTQNQRDVELIKRFRFPENVINQICDIIRDQLLPRHSEKGLPVPLQIQVY